MIGKRLQEGCDAGVPFTISVDGATLQVEGRLKHLEPMMLQDEATSCIVLGPVRHLHQHTGRHSMADKKSYCEFSVMSQTAQVYKQSLSV